jgi:transposase
MLRIVRDDEICRRLMSIPGVGPLVAITFKSAIDDPGRKAALLEPGTNQYAQRCMKRPM